MIKHVIRAITLRLHVLALPFDDQNHVVLNDMGFKHKAQNE